MDRQISPPLASSPNMPAPGGERRGSSTRGVRAALCAAVVSGAVAAVVPATSSGADVNSDKAQVAQLQQRIAADGATVQRYVAAYNAALIKQASIDAQLAAAQARVASDQHQESQALGTLRQAALEAYMSDANASTSLAVFEPGSATDVAAQQEYDNLASADIRNAVDAVVLDEQATTQAEATLRAEQAAAAEAVAQAQAARQSAQGALAQDELALGQAKGNLQAALAAIAAEQARAAQEEAALAALSSHPVTFTLHPSPGTYINPLQAVANLGAERIDQGVDYRGNGPILALGNGVVLSTSNSGWPGGTFIAYRLSDGPGAGLVVYAAEDIDPSVTVGESVSAGTVLGTVYEGPDGIETGWADQSGDGTTMARNAGQFSGSNSTAFGANFSQLLASLGAPPGVLQNNPPTGSLPPGWPRW